MRVPWAARRSNQSILKEINPEYSLEGLMLKLKFKYFGPLIRTADSLEKTLMLGKNEDKRRRGRITDSMDMNLSKLQKIVEDREPGVLQFMGSQRGGHDSATEQQQQHLLKDNHVKTLCSAQRIQMDPKAHMILVFMERRQT